AEASFSCCCKTIQTAAKQLDAPLLPGGRVRGIGGGRKRVRDKDPAILKALERLIAPETRGDPMSPLRWTCKSTRHLAEALAQEGFTVSHRLVGEMLHHLGYSLQANAKTLEGQQHPDRDAQFRYINRTSRRFLAEGEPVISVDTKKKELVGQYDNAGREWQPEGEPEEVLTHDFPDKRVGKAIPYGIYDLGWDLGWVNVGVDHDTASFAVESIRQWWSLMGSEMYSEARRLLICADGGGSNGYRLRLWKVELQGLADETGLGITVCHFPPGTSKWNRIEHRLFSHITMNWRGRPLVSHQVIVDLISATTTATGLEVEARLDIGSYPTKVKVSKKQMEQVRLHPHDFHGEWNYTIEPVAARRCHKL
ncbi:MAG TPA: ISAzo13 family transposase, partial [Gemmataceae bacterium]|nr:ISAzo13 family transposase [Gemmataceae bacterium]